MFWTKKKGRIFCLFVLGALCSHLALSWAEDRQQTGLLKRGDFASFYSAGMIVRQGLGAQLYDTSLLSYVENLYWPSLNGNYISFPYPPFVALALTPFAHFPPQTAKAIFTLLMILITAYAFHLGGHFAPVLKRNPLALWAFLFAFYPVSFGILGGQFSAINMLLYAGLLYAYSRNTKAGDIGAGICLGLWCFKPQYAAGILFFLMTSRAWRIVFPALGTAAIYYFLGALIQGFQWPWVWIQAAGNAAVIDFPHNDFNMISFTGFFHALGRIFGLSGSADAVMKLLSAMLSAGLLASTGFLFWKAGNIQETGGRRTRIQSLLTIAAPVLLLASPHALFYDIGICVIACAPYVKLDSDRSIWFLILITALALCLTAFKSYLPFQPMIFYTAGIFYFIARNANIGCGISPISRK